VEKWIHKNLAPLEVDTDVSFETWVSNTTYTLRRKDELRQVWSQYKGYLSKKEKGSESFSKAEAYSAWKHLRGINSRSDTFKCLVGPIFSAIEKVLFKMKWFIKKIPVRSRASHVHERLYNAHAGTRYYATDYSAFESHFDPVLMAECEFQLYEYMTTKIEGGAHFFELISEVLGSQQTCYYKGFTATGVESRMSGEMCTSLGNSFVNLMIFLFVCSKAGIAEEEVDGFVEGDDGLFRFLPGQAIDDSLFEKLGLTIKIEKHVHLHLASFCGLIFDPYSLNIITDPRKVIAQFGWADPAYTKYGSVGLKKLLRSKSLSIAHQYPGCPIVQSLAQYGLRMTKHMHNAMPAFADSMSWWKREILTAALADDLTPVHVTDEARAIVESKFDITPAEQIAIEKILDEKTDLSPINLGLPDYFAQEWNDCWARFVSLDVGDYPTHLDKPRYNNIPRFTEEWTCAQIENKDASEDDWERFVWVR